MKDKFKEDFKKWFYKNLTLKYTFDLEHWFPYLPFSMRYGILVDFFDSVGVFILINKQFDLEVYDFNIDNGTDFYESETFEFKTRHEARTEAIKKAKEIYNKTQVK